MRIIPAALVLTVLFTLPNIALAKSERTVGHTLAQVWPTVIRYLRVDEGFKLIEKDSTAGYIIFELSEEKKVFRGTLELISVGNEQQPHLKLVLQIADRPLYTESGLLKRLLQKIHNELDSTPSPPKAKKRSKTTTRATDPMQA